MKKALFVTLWLKAVGNIRSLKHQLDFSCNTLIVAYKNQLINITAIFDYLFGIHRTIIALV